MKLPRRRRRPELVERLGLAFTDKVSGTPVYRWRADDNTLWLATKRRSRFRVQTQGSDPTIGFVERVMGDTETPGP